MTNRDPEPTKPPEASAGGGRPIRLTPVPSGFWLVVGGGVVAALGPLFGFLLGSMAGGTTDAGDLDPIYLFLLLGLVIGGLGVGVLMLGVRRVIRQRRSSTG